MSTPWWQLPMVGVDFEATAVNPKEARPVSAAMVAVCAVPGAARNRWGDTEWLIDPGVEIPEGATQVHGITTERARAEGTPPGPSLDSIIERLIDLITEDEDEGRDPGVTRPIVGMNLAYDFTLLHFDALRHGLVPFRERVAKLGLTVPVIDIYVLDKQLDRYRPGFRRLGNLCKTYGVKHGGEHDAMQDVLASLRVAVKIGRSSYVGDLPTVALHNEQVGWRRRQCENLQAHFRRQGKVDAVVDPCWPACYPESHPEPAAPDEGLF